MLALNRFELGLPELALKKAHALQKELAQMSLMKTAVKKRRGGGNTHPCKREGFPEIEQDKVDDVLDSYIRKIGIKQAFNLHSYSHMQVQNAECAKSLHKCHSLLEALGKVSPTWKIKYKFLKQSLTLLVHRFGQGLLSHWEGKKEHLPGVAADCIGVMLNHWRRVSNSESNWQKFVQKLDDSQVDTMAAILKRMPATGDRPKKKLKKND